MMIITRENEKDLPKHKFHKTIKNCYNESICKELLKIINPSVPDFSFPLLFEI